MGTELKSTKILSINQILRFEVKKDNKVKEK
jgi:hypothetical protein